MFNAQGTGWVVDRLDLRTGSPNVRCYPVSARRMAHKRLGRSGTRTARTINSWLPHQQNKKSHDASGSNGVKHFLIISIIV